MNPILQSCSYYLRQLAKVQPILLKQHFEKVIHPFLASWLDYSNALYLGVSQSKLQWLQIVQNVAAQPLTEVWK